MFNPEDSAIYVVMRYILREPMITSLGCASVKEILTLFPIFQQNAGPLDKGQERKGED